MNRDVKRVRLFGCYIDNLTLEETVDKIIEFVSEMKPRQHVVVNVDKIVKCHRDPELLQTVNGCDIVNADGMPIVWSSYLLGRPLKERVTGIDLFGRLLREAESRGWPVYLLGARQEVLERAVSILRNRHKELRLAGFHHGYWSAEEEEAVVAGIRESGAKLLFVAMSSPRKEEFLGRRLRECEIPFAMGVGGTIDVLAGLTKRAPCWMQQCGLEWFYRFLQEPRRMFRRYFVDDAAFLWILLVELAKRFTGHEPAR